MPDTLVGDALLAQIFDPEVNDGIGLVVDGFPRTALQVSRHGPSLHARGRAPTRAPAHGDGACQSSRQVAVLVRGRSCGGGFLGRPGTV